MSPDARLDARIRAGLLDEPTIDEADTRDALRVVLDRSGRPARRRRTGAVVAMAAAAAAIVGLLVVPGLLLDDEPVKPPVAPPSVDSSVILGDWQRAVVGAETLTGSWRMDLGADGVVTLEAPAGSPVETDGVSYGLTDDLLRLDAFVNGVCAEQPAGQYRWAVVGATLWLTVVDEPCDQRAEVFEGSWTRPGGA
jgi:hypothetical protein